MRISSVNWHLHGLLRECAHCREIQFMKVGERVYIIQKHKFFKTDLHREVNTYAFIIENEF